MFHNALRSVARSACQMQRARFMSTSPFPTLAAPKQLQPTFFQPQPLMCMFSFETPFNQILYSIIYFLSSQTFHPSIKYCSYRLTVFDFIVSIAFLLFSSTFTIRSSTHGNQIQHFPCSYI